MSVNKFNSSELSFVAQSTDVMYASLKAFIETYFASYLCLGELDLVGLRQLCCDSDSDENDLSSPARDN